MTREEAYYHKLMLSAGISDDYDKYISDVLEKENPLSDVVLDLSFCTADRNETLAVINDYVAEAEIDYAVVFDLIWQYVHNSWLSGDKTSYEIAKLMYDIAMYLGEDKKHERPWSFMLWLDDYFELAELGMRVSKEALNEAFVEFAENKNTDKIYAL